MPYAHAEALVSTEWLAAHLDDAAVSIVDASFKLPGMTPTAAEDYATRHIPGAVFFDLDDISGQQFAAVGNVLLNSGHAAAGFPQIGRRQPDPREQIPVGLVEFADIPHDVHVADMVALPRIERPAIGCRRIHRWPRPPIPDTVAYRGVAGLAIRHRIKNR